jgi:hypothetical protein
VRIFLTRVFARFAKSEDIADSALREAVRRAEAGLIDADLGGGVIKQRVARRGGGKSGGYRTIILFRKESRAIFVFGFAKKDQDNITPYDLRLFRELAREVLTYSEAELAEMAVEHRLKEITSDD